MYFIELIIRKIIGKEKNADNFADLQDSELRNFESDYENCEHIFMPIDSTEEILSCSKCGFIVRKDSLKEKNFFNKKRGL